MSVTPNAAPQYWGITTDNNVMRVNADLKDSYVFTIVDVDTDDATGIIDATVNPLVNNDKNVYDLLGRKVTTTAKRGIYVQGGRKVIK